MGINKLINTWVPMVLHTCRPTFNKYMFNMLALIAMCLCNCYILIQEAPEVDTEPVNSQFCNRKRKLICVMLFIVLALTTCTVIWIVLLPCKYFRHFLRINVRLIHIKREKHLQINLNELMVIDQSST